MLCWEIFSSGEVPYQGYSNTKAREMIDSGKRLLNRGSERICDMESVVKVSCIINVFI